MSGTASLLSQGQVVWVDLGEGLRSGPAGRRPVLVVQADPFNHSALATTIVAVMSRNTRLGLFPGNVHVPAGSCGLEDDSIVNVTSLMSVDKSAIREIVGALPLHLWQQVAAGIASVLHSPFRG